MANPTNLPGDLVVPGNVSITGKITPGLARADVLVQVSLQAFTIPLTDFTTFDAMGTRLPSAGANDDLGLVGGTHGTNTPSLRTQDHQDAGSEQNNYARAVVALPWNYVAGSAIRLRFMAGMITNIADQAATTYLDCLVYTQQDDPDDAIGADLCSTAAITAVNTLTFANRDFTIAPSGLVAGDVLDVLVKTAVDDDATGAEVIMGISWVKLLCDVR